ncbi:NAD(P)/FAD-dependent oxidoreductase [Paenalcaligenes sp. Me131]|uniref:NAD(P)/FAD-dependent oxidoreductase n=1 Tax=Paenalcaligenes sp. Me131 TaxID=3392636 RepID=UPI003D27F004
MIHPAPKVVVVGGGIMGACIAWNLAKAGAKVLVLEQHAEPAKGATQWSYGWVGTASVLPSEAPQAFALKQTALREFSALEKELGTLPYAAYGALVWGENDEETHQLVAEQQAVGVSMSLMDQAAIRQLEPSLTTPPRYAAWAPDDFAIEPIMLTQQLLDAAKGLGAEVRYNTVVERLLVQGDTVLGVTTTQGDISAQAVVLANGVAVKTLLSDVGVDAPVYEAPAFLMRWQTDDAVVRHLVCANDLELRPDLQGGIVIATDYPEEGEAGLEALVQTVKTRLQQLLTPAPSLELRGMAGARRPLVKGGMPYRKKLSNLTNLYTLVAHPGIILSPYLARLSAQEIMDGI